MLSKGEIENVGDIERIEEVELKEPLNIYIPKE
jgi:hypothetical protein